MLRKTPILTIKLLKGSQKLSVLISKKNKGDFHNEMPYLLMSDTLPSYTIQEDNFIFYVQLAQVRGKLEFTRVKLSDTASCGIRSSSRDLF